MVSQQHVQQQQYLTQLHALQLQQQQQQQQSAASNSSVAMKRAKMAALGFMMGALVGSTVVGLHALLHRSPLQQAIKNAAGTGGAFGTIFAVGTFLRPTS